MTETRAILLGWLVTTALFTAEMIQVRQTIFDMQNSGVLCG